MLISVFAFVIAFGLLVIVHEFGHFWVARACGIAVETFSIGFGPKLFRRKWRETDFCISLIPLGGYVKMKGEGDEKEIAKDDPAAFSNKSVGRRSAVVVAGPIMNLILSFVLVPLVFWVGKPSAPFLKESPVIERILPNSPASKVDLRIGDQIIAIWKADSGRWLTAVWKDFLDPLFQTPPGQWINVEIQRGDEKKIVALQTQALPGALESYIGIEKYFGKAPEPVVEAVLDGSAAQAAGLQSKDRIRLINEVPIQSWDDLLLQVEKHPGEELHLVVFRDGREQTITLKPRWDEEAQRWLMGVQGAEAGGVSLLEVIDYNLWESVKTGFKVNVRNIGLTLQTLKKLITAEVSVKALGGPVAIATSLAKASASGLADFIYFTAFLSIQLGILNLLPIPVLDGGHLLFFGYEAIRRKPLSLKARLVAQQIGMVLLLALILVVTWNDIRRLIGI